MPAIWYIDCNKRDGGSGVIKKRENRPCSHRRKNAKPIIKDEFLSQIKKYLPCQTVWKSWLESFLEENYNNPDLDLQNLMRHFQISKSHGCALFKKYVGKTFRAKLKEIRLEKAKPLVEGTHLQIGEIADLCGFRSAKRSSSLWYFTKWISDEVDIYKKNIHLQHSPERNFVSQLGL